MSKDLVIKLPDNTEVEFTLDHDKTTQAGNCYVVWRGLYTTTHELTAEQKDMLTAEVTKLREAYFFGSGQVSEARLAFEDDNKITINYNGCCDSSD
jgi:hypothetical protein